MGYGKTTRPGTAAQPNSTGLGYPFEQALQWIKSGMKVSRHGWNGQGMYIYLVNEHAPTVDQFGDETSMLVGQYAEGEIIVFAARIDMRYANGQFGAWSPTHEDLLADDWRVLR